jgi:hypothetical protein
MSLPRSSSQVSQAPGAVANFTFANVAFTPVTTLATVVTTLNLPRSFKPQKPIQVVLGNVGSGLTVGNPYVTGNAPSCSSCSPSNYVLNIPITNATAGTLTPTTQTVRVIQD